MSGETVPGTRMSGRTRPGGRSPGRRAERRRLGLPGGRTSPAVAIALTAPLVLSACTAAFEDAPVDAGALKRQQQDQVNAPHGFAPLTGRPATSKTAAARPALAVAVRAGARTTGLDAADFVYYEAGSGRVVALFQSAPPTRVGPVAETRPFDAKMLPVTSAIVATAGGPDKFVRQLTKAKTLTSLTTSGYAAGFRGGYAIPRNLYRKKRKDAKAPPKLAEYATPSQQLAPRGSPTTKLTVELPGADEVWNYDATAKAWRRAGNLKFSAANVVVQLTKFKRTPLKTGGSVPSAKPYGKGTVTALSAGPSGGQFTAGTWRKPGTQQLTTYGAGKAKPLLFNPGPTWVIIAPIGTKVRTE